MSVIKSDVSEGALKPAALLALTRNLIEVRGVRLTMVN